MFLNGQLLYYYTNIHYNYHLFYVYRGKDFQKEYGKLVELRGFFWHNVCIMALTATASPSTRKDIMKKLGMRKPHTIVRCPNKPKILKPVVDNVRLKRTKANKTIITYRDCSAIYSYFKETLKENMTDPPGYPDVAKFRIVNMFTACNSSTGDILKSFSMLNGRLLVVIATIAFGMGIDCSNVREIIHWGPPADCESYIQETGHAGQDGQQAYATLYYSNKEISLPYIQQSMAEYCMNMENCRREVLFTQFDYTPRRDTTIICNCCDICAIICTCDQCQFDDNN